MNDRVKLLAVIAVLAFVASSFLGYKVVMAYKAHQQETPNEEVTAPHIDTRAIRPLDRSAVMQICLKAAEKGDISGCRPDYSDNTVKFRVIATSSVLGEVTLSEYSDKASYRTATKVALAGVLSPKWKSGMFEMGPTAMVVVYADSKVHDVTKTAIKEALNAYELQLGGKAIY